MLIGIMSFSTNTTGVKHNPSTGLDHSVTIEPVMAHNCYPIQMGLLVSHRHLLPNA